MDTKGEFLSVSSLPGLLPNHCCLGPPLILNTYLNWFRNRPEQILNKYLNQFSIIPEVVHVQVICLKVRLRNSTSN